MSIEEILKGEGKKLEERTNINHPLIISIPANQAKGICKYKKGEIIIPIGGSSGFKYLGPSEDGHDFRYIQKNETIQ